MQASYEQDPANPKKVKLTLTEDNGLTKVLYLTSSETLNHLSASFTKSAELIYRDTNGKEEAGHIDFTSMTSFDHPISVARSKGISAQAPLAPEGKTVSFKQNGRWLGKDGWSESREFLPVTEEYRAVETVSPPPIEQTPAVPTAKICRNILANGSACNSTNRVHAIVCYHCGDDKHFELVY